MVQMKKSRFQGCLLGLACGDAVGTTVEFKARGTFTPVTDMTGGGPFRLRPGEWTDDTSMALCLAVSLLDKLKELPYWRGRWITVGYAAAFPDVAVKGGLRLDAPRELILDGSNMADLAAWVNQALQYLQGRRPDDHPLGTRGIEELTALLSPSWDLRRLLSTEIEEEKRELARLTEEQFIMLDFLGRHRRVAISGCAGSGKTTLAVEKDVLYFVKAQF